jgi:CheY-like chemotaxis protein
MGERLHILLVEDNVLDAELLLRELKRNGYTPVSARVETPEELSAMLAGGPWDLVIADNSMPRFSGAMVLERLRGIERVPPVIIVSGSYSAGAAEGLIGAGAQDFVAKGDTPALLDAIGRALAAGAGAPPPTGPVSGLGPTFGE